MLPIVRRIGKNRNATGHRERPPGSLPNRGGVGGARGAAGAEFAAARPAKP